MAREKTYKTSYGLEYKLLTPEEWDKKKNGFMPYDRSIGDMHIRNYGYAIANARVGDLIDDESDLMEISRQIKSNKALAKSKAQGGKG